MSKDLISPTIDNIENVSVEIKKPIYLLTPHKNSQEANDLISQLGLDGHQEGGYFKETDRSPYHLVNPYNSSDNPVTKTTDIATGNKELTRNYSTLIYYLVTPEKPFGRIHKNKSRIIHILQRGSGQYVLIYPTGEIKSFRVGFDFARGEVAQWVVPSDVWKASFISDKDEMLLISEVVVPGFEYLDHSFMEDEKELGKLVGKEKADELHWLLGKD